MTTYLDLEQSLAIVRHLGLHVRDVGLLSSALARPSSAMFGVEAYPDLFGKAAALLSSLGQNHPLFDGNKRVSWVLALTFLELNDVVIDMPTDDAFELVLRTAQGMATLEEIAATLAAHVSPAE